MSGMMNDIEQDYFHWLCEIVDIDQGNGYWLLARDLHRRAFVPMIEHDENREADGMGLREEYLRENRYSVDRMTGAFNGECSMLEMIVALSRHMDFETADVYDGGKTRDRTAYWFWDIMHNLKLDILDDESYLDMGGREYVDSVIDDVVNREYDFDGNGGLFPLNMAYEDQRDVELWYQMACYLNEREEI